MIDPVSAIGSATSLGAGIGLLIRIGNFIAGHMSKRQEERTKRDAILRGDVKDFQQSVDAAVDVELKRIHVENELTWTLGHWVVLQRKWKSNGTKPVWTLRQHAISFTIYWWVFIIGSVAALCLNKPDIPLWTINPTATGSTGGFFWQIFGGPHVDIPFVVTTGGVGWYIIAAMCGIVSLLVTGVAGTRR